MNTPVENISNKKMNQIFFFGFVLFAVLFYGIVFVLGGFDKYRDGKGWLLRISRDFVYIFLLTFLLKKTFFHKSFSIPTEYSRFIKTFFILMGVYLILVLIHLTNKSPLEIAHHEVRNIILYSLFLPFLPILLTNNRDIFCLVKTLLAIGVLEALFGVITYFLPFKQMTLNGRVMGTLGDPNNYAVFLTLCMLLTAALWDKFKTLKAVLLFAVYLPAFIFANSITGLVTLICGLFIVFLFKKGFLKALLLSVVFLYLITSFSWINKQVTQRRYSPSEYTDRYLIFKINVVTHGKFQDIFYLGLGEESLDRELQALESVKSSAWRTIKKRVEMYTSLLDYPAKKSIGKLLLGDFTAEQYKKTDSQYINFLENTGIASALIFILIFVNGAYQGLKTYKKHDSAITLALAAFIISMVSVAFLGAAFLNRFPINFFLYLSLGIIFLEKDRIIKVADEAAKV